MKPEKNETFYVNIYLNYNCNLDCEYCYVRRGKCQELPETFKNIKYLNFEKIIYIKKILDETKKPYKIFLIGGEPLLYKEINKIIELFQDHEIFINTNLTDLKILNLDKLNNNRNIHFIISLHYPYIKNSDYRNNLLNNVKKIKDHSIYFVLNFHKNYEKYLKYSYNFLDILNTLKIKFNLIINKLNFNDMDHINDLEINKKDIFSSFDKKTIKHILKKYPNNVSYKVFLNKWIEYKNYINFFLNNKEIEKEYIFYTRTFNIFPTLYFKTELNSSFSEFNKINLLKQYNSKIIKKIKDININGQFFDLKFKKI